MAHIILNTVKYIELGELNDWLIEGKLSRMQTIQQIQFKFIVSTA